MPKHLIYIFTGLTLLSAAFFIYFGYNTYRNYSLPPGCQKPIIPTFGGCFSKFSIKNIAIDSQHTCFEVTPNNCNSPSLTVRNSCQENIIMNGTVIPPSVEKCYETSQDFFITRNDIGQIGTSESRTCLDPNEHLFLSGQVGEQSYNFNISFRDIAVEKNEVEIPPEFRSCFSVFARASDCATVSVRYSCSEPLTIGQEIIQPKDLTCQTVPGEKEIVKYESAPEEDKRTAIQGMLGENPFRINYTVTKKQCE